MIIKTATENDLDLIYRGDGLGFLNTDFNLIINDAGEMEEFEMKLNSSKVELKEDTTVYVVSGELLNKYYDLEGDNAYEEDEYYSVIPFDQLVMDPEKMERMDWIRLRGSLYIRFWKDIIDNLQYTEYVKGRHPKTENIQWLIDLNSKDDSLSVKYKADMKPWNN